MWLQEQNEGAVSIVALNAEKHTDNTETLTLTHAFSSIQLIKLTGIMTVYSVMISLDPSQEPYTRAKSDILSTLGKRAYESCQVDVKVVIVFRSWCESRVLPLILRQAASLAAGQCTLRLFHSQSHLTVSEKNSPS